MFIIYSIIKNQIKIKHRLVSKVPKVTIKCKENDNNAAKNASSYRILLLKRLETKFRQQQTQERYMCKYLATSL